MMNIKQNVDYIKEEMQNDEKMLESALRLESWFRRNQKPLIALVVILVLFGIGYSANTWYQANTQQKISNYYENALKGDESAITALKESKSNLYDLYRFKQALKNNDTESLKALESSKDSIIAQFAKMQNASLEKNLTALNSKDSGDLGYLQAAFLEIQAGNMQKAKEILSKIKNDSPIKELANTLAHFSIKGTKNAE
ncbi:MAG: tetratricopeptide repeat protein [Helicobacter sp.]|nr:tetratricopeptide repeat protein [Helicobacter sp.]